MAEANRTNPDGTPTEVLLASVKKRILCVDDDQHTNELLNFWLAQNGYDVTTATSQTEALSWARRTKFDLYLLDDWLPDGRGKDLLLMIRDFDPDTPIVFFSGNVEAVNQAEVLRLGAQAFISKPAVLNKVTEVIARLLASSTGETSEDSL